MHRNITEKERVVLGLAFEYQKDWYIENAKKTGDNYGLEEVIQILDNLLDKLCGASENKKDILKKTDTQTTVGYSLKEAQGMYIALYMFRLQCKQLLSIDDFNDWPKNELMQPSDLEEYIRISTDFIEELEKSFKAANIDINDFFTIHDNDESFYKATGLRIKGADRNSPCPCGSGKKYKNCCGKY